MLILAATLIYAACDGPVGTEVEPSCPPMSGPQTATLTASTDVSSVTVPDGTTGEYDDGGYWCDPDDLEVHKVDVNSLITSHGCFNNKFDKTPPCSPNNALAAIDVYPSFVAFNSSPKPSLIYDLSVTDNKPECMEEGVTCGGYEFYQLIKPTPATGTHWRPVGSATLDTYSGKIVAKGNVNHFSTFALVELPIPRTIQPPLEGEMIVASEFLFDDQNAIRVAFEIVNADLPEIGETRLFRFLNLDPSWDENKFPEECVERGSIADQLTCLFPIDMPVFLELGINNSANLNKLTSLDQGYPAEFYAIVEIY